jgi:hypothetical protein
MIKNALVVETTLGLLLNGSITVSQVTKTASEYYTDFNFDEGFVSRVLSNLIDNSVLLYTYEGNNKSYKLNVSAFIQEPLVQSDSTYVEYQRMIQLMSQLVKDDKVRVTFKKKDGSNRVLTGVVLEPNKGDGKVLFVDLDLDAGDNIRSVDVRKVKELIVDDVEYYLV